MFRCYTVEHATQIIRNFANAPLAAEHTDWYPVPPFDTITLEPTYQSVLRREVETLFGTANHAVVAALVHPVCSAIPLLYDRVFDRLMPISELRHSRDERPLMLGDNVLSVDR